MLEKKVKEFIELERIPIDHSIKPPIYLKKEIGLNKLYERD